MLSSTRERHFIVRLVAAAMAVEDKLPDGFIFLILCQIFIARRCVNILHDNIKDDIKGVGEVRERNATHSPNHFLLFLTQTSPEVSGHRHDHVSAIKHNHMNATQENTHIINTTTHKTTTTNAP